MASNGLDVDAARSLVQQLQGGAATLNGIINMLSAALDSTSWDGNDAQSFRNLWLADLEPALHRSEEVLRENGQQLLREINEQVAASEASGGVVDEYFGRVGSEVKDKPLQVAADLALGWKRDLLEVNVKGIKESAGYFRDREQDELRRASSAETPQLRKWHLDEAEKLGRDRTEASQRLLTTEQKWAARGMRIGSKVPVAGAALTVVGIGYDMVINDKPVGQSIISGLGGAAAAVAVGSIGAALALPITTAVAATVVGVGASVALDMAYEHLPAGVQAGIEAGADAMLVEPVKEAADGAQKLWNSIF